MRARSNQFWQSKIREDSYSLNEYKEIILAWCPDLSDHVNDIEKWIGNSDNADLVKISKAFLIGYSLLSDRVDKTQARADLEQLLTDSNNSPDQKIQDLYRWSEEGFRRQYNQSPEKTPVKNRRGSRRYGYPSELNSILSHLYSEGVSIFASEQQEQEEARRLEQVKIKVKALDIEPCNKVPEDKEQEGTRNIAQQKQLHPNKSSSYKPIAGIAAAIVGIILVSKVGLFFSLALGAAA